MSKAGGPATLYGVLYQILGSVRWACELSLSDAQVSDDDIHSARLVLEPADGGDLTVEKPSQRIVEQWKSRRNGRPWRIRETLSDVVPDLYLAVDLNDIDRTTIFRFRAEGEVGEWEQARTFFARLGVVDVNAFTIAELDDEVPLLFMGGRETLTERQFFLWIASHVEAAQQRRGNDESPAVRHRRLCYLLANFEIPPSQSAAEIELEIDRCLRPWVDYADPDLLAAKRSEMCGRLLKIASEGQAVIRPREFLRSVGLTAIPLTSWPLIRDLLQQSASDAAAKLLHYKPTLDVRHATVWPGGKPVLVLTGEGGCGKSWQLASLACEKNHGETAVVLFRAFGDPQRDLDEAARCVWQLGVGHEPPLDLGGIARRL